MAVIDSSVWLDLFLENEQRAKRVETILEHVKSIYEPKVFKVEIAGTLARRFKKEDISEFLDEILTRLKLSKIQMNSPLR